MMNIKIQSKALAVVLALALSIMTMFLLVSCEETVDPPAPGEENHTVRILDTDGTELFKMTGENGAAVVYLPEKTGYKFGGYYSDSALSSSVNFSGTVGESDLDLYVKWEPIHYTIRFDSGRALGEMDEIVVAYDEKVTLPASTFVLRNESFEEWQMVGSDGVVTSFVDCARIKNLTSVDGDVLTLTAIFDNYDSANFTVENGVVIAYNGTSESVRLPETATSVSSDVFKDCLSASSIKKLEVPSCYTEIGKGAFAPLTSLEEIKVPFIGGSKEENNFFAYVFGADTYMDNRFSFEAEIYISSLTEVNADYSNLLIPKTLKKVVITDSLYSIAEGAFYHAYSIEKIVLLDSDELYEIGASAFEGCINLGYDNELGISNPLNWLGNVETIGNRAFAAYISEENSEGGSYLFTRLFEISPLEKIKTIGNEAFYGCVYLLDLTVGDSLVSIGDSAFVNCVSLTKVALPDSLTSVGAYAFTSCSGLTEVSLGTGLSSLGSFAFADCTALAQVTLRGNAPARIAQIPFSNGVEYATDIYGQITGYTPIYTSLTLYVENEAVDTYRKAWVDYVDLFDVKTKGSVFYWGANSDGTFATKFEIQGGNLAYVTDTALEFLDLIDLFSDFYNTFRADLVGNEYTLTFEEIEIPDELKRGNEEFYYVSNPQIVDALGDPTKFLVRVRPERYDLNGTTYYVPTIEYINTYFGTLGENESSLVKIDRDEWGHYILSTREDTSSEFAEYMPEGAVYGEYRIFYILAYTEKMVGMDWYDEKGNVIASDKYLVCEDCLYPCKGDDGLEISFTSYPNQIILDGKGNALLSLYENGSFTEYVGSYSVSADQKLGDDILTVSLVSLTGSHGEYNGTMQLDGFFGGSYHRCKLNISSDNGFLNETFYSYADYSGERVCYADDGTYYAFYDYELENGTDGATYVEYYDGSVSAHGVYTELDGVITITIPNYRDVVGYIDDPRGSFHIDTVFGSQTYSAYDDWENATFSMEEDFLGVILTYYLVKMDGYGNALFYDGHDDGYDNWYIGTYYNTHEVIGSDENGDFEIYYFEGLECDENGNILKNAKSYSAYYVPDTIVYDEEDEEGNYTYYGALLSVSSTTESSELVAYDERGCKFADLTVSPFGVVTLTIYDTIYDNGEYISTVNEVLTENLQAVAYQTSSGQLVYVVVYDAAGNYMFRIVQDDAGDWIYEYEGELSPKEAPADDKIIPSVEDLVLAD